MPFTLTMPKLSPTMEEGTIAKWHKKEGDFIESGDLILEIETDKATVEHNALDEGYLKRILAKEGDTVAVNKPIAVLTEEKDENIQGYKPEGEEKESQAEPEKEKAEEKEKKEKEPASQKSTMEQAQFVPEPPLKEYIFQHPRKTIEKQIKASPLAKKLAREKGLDLTTVKGTGPGGRIVSEDLERAQKTGAIVFGRREMPNTIPGSYEEEGLSQTGKVVARRLQEAKTFIPHFYVSQIIDAAPLVHAREQLRANDIKVTCNDFVIRASALSLREHPYVNSGFNSVNQTVILFKTIDVSVAVDTKAGLITPIIRHADYKNLGEISVEIRSLAKKAKNGKLAMEEYKGGSFTVSNLGMYGITDFLAIINPPQSAILSVGGIRNIPVIKDGQVVPGKVLTLTLSCDHRVVDGVTAAQFIKTLQKFLENPCGLVI